MYTYDKISLKSSWNEKYFRKTCWVNDNTFFTFNNFFFSYFKNRVIYEIM